MSQHVLVPVDGSSESEQALAYVLDEMTGSKLTLIHVFNPARSFGYGEDEYFDFEAYQAEVDRAHGRAEELLDEYRETASERGFEVETLLATGKPARQILDAVESEGVDHVVMGSRGRSGLGRVLFGSVAEAVTRRAPVPVTIIR